MMPSHLQDEVFMQRALRLAADTAALASPNPHVGCVLVRDNKIFAEGAHIYDQRDHAEIVALKQAAERGLPTKGATAYVTLEPCSHHGRTGPCADALIAAGIARCVIATVDPNPLVSGQGIAKLQAAGIEVPRASCNNKPAASTRPSPTSFAPALPSSRSRPHYRSTASWHHHLPAASPTNLTGSPVPPHAPKSTTPPRLRRRPHRHRHRPSRQSPPHRSK